MNKYKYDGSHKFKISDFDCSDTGEFKERHMAVKEFIENLEQINENQQKLFAEKKEGIIFVFQAMDAAGKDGAVRAVLSCLSPQGVSEHSFKTPTAEENAHDYLWRFWKALPEKGHISIFNRSHYEDVLIQKVHSYYLNNKYADRIDKTKIIEQRYEQINSFEKYLWENSFRVIKIFLNVSKEEQARRFISRIETPKKNWKFSSSDIEERDYWDDYMEAFESCINNTAKKNTPWYVVPADHKWYARLIISRIILDELKNMNPQWPELPEEEKQKMDSYKAKLVIESKAEELIMDDKSKGFDIKPAATAMTLAFNSNYIATNKKNSKKKAKEYVLQVLKNNHDISAEYLQSLADAYIGFEEMTLSEELERMSTITDLYDELKKDIKKSLQGSGKEGKKLLKRFKKECKDLAEKYRDVITQLDDEYNQNNDKVISKFEANIGKKMNAENAINMYKADLEKEYKSVAAKAEKIVKDIAIELAEIHDNYAEIAQTFKTSNKVDAALEEANEKERKKQSK